MSPMIVRGWDEPVERASCGVCPATVLWVVVARSGKKMPLDPAPRADGNVHLDHAGQAVILGKAARARLDAARATNGQEPLVWYVTHFVTCAGKRRGPSRGVLPPA